MNPLYITIRNDLLKMIEDGVYAENELLPSESEIAKSYDVSRPTARRAVQSLVDEGYLERRPYHGVVVKSSNASLNYPEALRSPDSGPKERGGVPETRVLFSQTMPANAEISSGLEIPINDDVFKLVRLRYVEGEPNSFLVSYVPIDLYPDIEQVNFEKESLYGYFESCGQKAVRAARRLEVALADGSISALLNIPRTDPVFRLYTTARDEPGRVVELSIAVYRGRSNVFEFSANADVVAARDGAAESRDESPRLLSIGSDLIG